MCWGEDDTHATWASIVHPWEDDTHEGKTSRKANTLDEAKRGRATGDCLEKRRGPCLNKSEKALLQSMKGDDPAKELPGTVAETPPHYWVTFECADSAWRPKD